jgi:hypothetical protein
VRNERRLPVAAAIGVACIVVYIVLLGASQMRFGGVGDYPGTDSYTLASGARVALDCVDDGVWRECGHAPRQTNSGVAPYALLQYAPAAAAVKAGLNTRDTVKAMARVSYVAFIVMLALVVVAARKFRWRGWTPLLVIAVLSTPILYQATSSFGESLAATAVMAAVVAALWKRPVLLAIATFAAGVSKETMIPFVVLLVLAVGRDDGDAWPPARVLVPTGLAAVAAFVANSAFNIFRFGTWRNTFYLLPIFQTPMARRPGIFAGLWLSPSVGLLLYATLATVLIAATAFAAFRGLVQHPRQPRSWAPALAVTAAVAGFTAVLASWFAPLGWEAYGSRLMMPFLPAAVVAAAYSAEPFLLAGMRRLAASTVASVGAGLVVVVAGLPQFASPWGWTKAMTVLHAPTAACTRAAGATVWNQPGPYFNCLQSVVWRARPFVLGPVVTNGVWQSVAGMILLGGATVALLVATRRSLLLGGEGFGQFSAGRDAELPVGVAEVPLHRLERDEQLLGNDLVGLPVAGHAADTQLAGREGLRPFDR